MSELRTEIEKAIQQTSDSFHDSTAWFDMGYRDINGKRYIENLVDRIVTLLAPTLPPVSPEDLVEGETYLAKPTNEDPFIVGYVGGKPTGMEHYRGWFVRLGEEGEFCHSTSTTYYGPLRFKIGGAE